MRFLALLGMTALFMRGDSTSVALPDRAHRPIRNPIRVPSVSDEFGADACGSVAPASTQGDLGGKYNMSGISPLPGQVASGLWGTDVTLSRYVCIYAGEIASPLSAHKTQGFVAGHSVAYAFIT